MLVTVPQLVDRMSGVSLDLAQRGEAERLLSAVQRALERYLNRPLEGGERTERTVTDSQGIAWLAGRPQTVRSVVVLHPAPFPAQPVLYWRPVPGGLDVGMANVDVTVVYVLAPVELAPGDLDDVRTRILDVAARAMGQAHDDVLTVSDLTTRNERAEGASSPRWWQPAELAEFDRLRRRTVA